MCYETNTKENTSVKQDATVKLAGFISSLEYEKLPPDVVQKSKEAILDYIGALLAGCSRGSMLKVKG